MENKPPADLEICYYNRRHALRPTPQGKLQELVEHEPIHGVSVCWVFADDEEPACGSLEKMRELEVICRELGLRIVNATFVVPCSTDWYEKDLEEFVLYTHRYPPTREELVAAMS